MGLKDCASNTAAPENMQQHQLDGTDDSSIHANMYDVVIIGNGPASIMLSYLLSGHWPYYNGLPCDLPVLQDKLDYVSQQQSLVLEDLDWLSEGLFDSRSFNPVSILFDQMNKPNADMLTREPSLLEWRHHPSREVRHLVVGLGPVGGTWHRMHNSQRSVSLSHWLELPGYSFQQWRAVNQQGPTNPHCAGVHEDRVNASCFGLYYKDYVDRMGLARNFVNNVSVTSVQQVPLQRTCYKIEGTQHLATAAGATSKTQAYKVFAGNVTLACGAFNRPRLLHIPGEDLPFVHHKLPSNLDLFSDSEPVLVVGCGLVALDTVLALMQSGIPVLHAFRKDARDPGIILNQLSSAYADYLLLKPLMRGEQVHALYTPLVQHTVHEIHAGKIVTLQKTSAPRMLVQAEVQSVLVQIGSLPDLRLVEESNLGGGGCLLEDPAQEFHAKDNPIEVDLLSMESAKHKGLYAMGPLVGDTFVRFILGGALAITSNLFKPNGYMAGKCAAAVTQNDVTEVTQNKANKVSATQNEEDDEAYDSSPDEKPAIVAMNGCHDSVIAPEEEECAAYDSGAEGYASGSEEYTSSGGGYASSSGGYCSSEGYCSSDDAAEQEASVKGLYEYLDPITIIDPDLAMVAGV